MDDSFSTYHPLINFSYFVFVIGMAMFMTHPVMMAISLISAFLYSFVLMGVSKALKFNLLYMLPVSIISALINPLFNHRGVTILFYLENGNPITLESIIYGLVLSAIIITVILWFSSYNKIMTSDKFVYLFGRIIPGLSLIFSMVLRFVPKFTNQLKVISNGQKCIGRDVTNGNFVQRAKNGIKILSILITWSLENAIDTADSMKARGYGLPGRSAFSIYRFDSRDRRLTLMMVVLMAVIIWGLSRGAAFAQYDPMIKIAGFSPDTPVNPAILTSYLAYLIFCNIPVLTDAVEAVKWHYLKSAI